MDAWALNLRRGGGVVVRAAIKKPVVVQRPASSSRAASGGQEDVAGDLKVRILATRRRASSVVVRAAGKKKNDDDDGDNIPSIPEENEPGGIYPAHDKSQFDDLTHRSDDALLDWRYFRANLVSREQDPASHEPFQLGSKWAHPISMPETGCVLIATEKLDGVRSFERSVVLLLRLGNRDPREGPFGVIINRPLHKKIKQMKPSNPDLATTFADCSLHFGGPLDASMFLLKTRENSSIPGFEQVVPGICFGARNNLDEAAELIKNGVLRPQDFRFFVGYAGWQLDQLKEEIESNYWIVASCSSYLISGESANYPSGLWEEILQLMGGQYSEMSQKPNPDSS